jgi:hypothetical protein
LGLLVEVGIADLRAPGVEARVKSFYEVEMAIAISPATLKKWIDINNQSYILVGLRSEAEYKLEHFKIL